MHDTVIKNAADDDRALQWSVEQFMYLEADLLDEREFSAWLELLHEDFEYQMPLRRNVNSRDLDKESSYAGRDVMWFDEGKDTLSKRVIQLQTGEHWAEEPVSRVTHVVTNVRLISVTPEAVTASARFIVYRNRVDTETSILIGRRTDTLVPTEEGSWLYRKRVVILDQSVLMAKSLTMFL
jgi:3-phenylpropionate/cinnamic acid dioxygenase small subunit